MNQAMEPRAEPMMVTTNLHTEIKISYHSTVFDLSWISYHLAKHHTPYSLSRSVQLL